MLNKIFITTPIYYASGKPHLGHCFSTILADVYAEFNRILHKECFLLTGMDEHGQKIIDKANTNHLTAKEFVDNITKDFKNLWFSLDINYQTFIRTTNKNHEQAIQQIFEYLLKKNDIYLSYWKGLYCIQCEENYTQSTAIKKDNKLYCKLDHELVYKTEESYFLKLSNYQKWLETYYNEHPNFIIPSIRFNEIMNNFIAPGIEDLSITRTTFDWGIKTISHPQHVIYVWIDALMSYLTGLGYLSNNDTNYQEFWNNDECEKIHIIGKEITRFHGIYWPILLHCLNLKLPTRIISHGWIITKEGKMSKSLGNVVDPNEYISKYGSDSLRYYLLKSIGINHDGIFNEELFINTFNSDLANNYGNFISRSIGMINKYTNGILPDCKINLNSYEEYMINSIQSLINNLNNLVYHFNFQTIINKVMDILSMGNKYIENIKPWKLFKTSQNDKLNEFISIIYYIAISTSYLMSPILKKGTQLAFQQLNVNKKLLNLESLKTFNKYPNHKINTSTPIYKRIIK